MRCDEIIHVNRSHVSIFPDHVNFFVLSVRMISVLKVITFIFQGLIKITCPVSTTFDGANIYLYKYRGISIFWLSRLLDNRGWNQT